jgi:indolepyruvate ferredoxin oxidoreductase beta subunit
MKQDIILAGVGGQGILSIAYVIDNAALAEGLQFKQAEVHGMAQLSVEPLEAARYFDYLGPEGIVVTSSTPFKNIPDYPDLAKVLEAVRSVKRNVVVDSEKIAKEAGTSKAQNMVMLGAASDFLILKRDSLLSLIEALFKARGPAIVEANLKAFELGRRAAAGTN